MKSASSCQRQTVSLDSEQRSPAIRESVSWRATYTYEANGFKYTDEAALRDVSRTGCGIRGRTRLSVGSKTTVRLYLLDQKRPLSIAAKVTWVAGEFFGVLFLGLSKDNYERIQRHTHAMPAEPPAGAQVVPPLKKERQKATLGLAVSLLLLGALSGCETLPPPVTASSAPFLIPTSDDSVQLALRAAELDAIALECAAASTCDEQVHFSRALVSLFENREAARASFDKVISLHPSSALAKSSTLWLQLLSDDAHPLNVSYRPLLIELTTQWAREWMTRPLTVRSTAEPTIHIPQTGHVQALHQQVRERDRHIARLRAQLDALRVINQDQEERRKMRPPTSFVPKLDQSR